MENQNNHSNKGIVIAVLCLIIGVVLGAVVINMKSPAVSQEGAALKASTAQTAVTTGNTSSLFTDFVAKYVTNSSGKKPVLSKEDRTKLANSISSTIGSGNPSNLYVVLQCDFGPYQTNDLGAALNLMDSGTCSYLGMWW